MDAKALLDAGQLRAAIEQLNQDVRAHPLDVQHRTFLFELLCFAGDYQRAMRQLDALSHQSVTADVGGQLYRNVLTAAAARQRLFTDGLPPHFLSEPPPYAAWHIQAINRLRQQQSEEADALLAQSAASRTALHGQLDGVPFSDLRDGDDVLAPFLEVIVHDRYVWLPFEHIKQVRIAPPRSLRDLLWIPATIEAYSGPVGGVFLPVLYPDSQTHADERVQLGRMTDWLDVGAGLARGAGQRLLFSDGQDKAILEIRDIAFIPEVPTASSQ